MYGKEKVNNKQKRLFDTSFIQNGKEKSTRFIIHPDKNKRPLVFAILADVVLIKIGKCSQNWHKVVPEFK